MTIRPNILLITSDQHYWNTIGAFNKTGQYPSQHKAYSLGTKLPESEHTVGEDLIASNYRTALIGKAHFQPLASTEIQVIILF